MTQQNFNAALPPALAKIHEELGISATYAAERRLTPYSEAVESQLLDVGINDEGRAIRLIRPAAEAWARMRRAAAREDVELVPVSGYRSISRQIEIFREKLASGDQIDTILRYVAAPGFSEHHTGRAIDIASNEHIELDEEFANTTAFRWLASHAGNYGFALSYPRDNPYGIGYEPWHWFWR